MGWDLSKKLGTRRILAVLFIVALFLMLIIVWRNQTFLKSFWQESPSLKCDCPFIHPLVIEKRIHVNNPAWSPDGTMIAFDKADISSQYFRESTTSEIYIIKPDGQGLKQLTSDNIDDTGPTWASDGKSVVFVSYNGTKFPEERYFRKIDLETGKISIIFRCQYACNSPNWSPDGKWIAYKMWQPSQPPDIWLLDMDTLKTHLFAPAPDGSFGMTWSPDSAQLVFARRTGIVTSQIVSLAIDGSGKETVFPVSGYLGYPAWYPAKDIVAFVREDGGADRKMIYLSDTKGANPVPLIDQPLEPKLGRGMHSPSLAPDGKAVVFVYGDGISGELYLADLSER